MTEYIERAAIMEFPIRKDHCDKERANEHFIFGIESVLEYVQNLPAADVAPVVRCRDCKHFRVYIGRDMCAKNVKLLGGREVGLCATGKDDFCSHGRRKNDE